MTLTVGKGVKTSDQCYCPYCKKLIDGASGAQGDHTPSEGDVSLCVYCQGVSVFNKDLTIRPITDVELQAMDPETRKVLDEASHVLKRIKNASPFYH